MNERIKELMGKTLDSEFSHTWDTMTYEGLLQFSDKFAELIIQECIDVVVDVLPDIVPESKDGIHPAWHLKEHFGVES
jgi:hypothetical protein